MTTTKYDTTNINWDGITISIGHCPAYFGAGSDYEIDHIEIRAIEPSKARLPMTETGYRSHFASPADVEAAGGPVALVETWLAEASRTREWRDYRAASQQLSLF